MKIHIPCLYSIFGNSIEIPIEKKENSITPTAHVPVIVSKIK